MIKIPDYKHLTVQCLNCARRGRCGEEKALRVCTDGINCENFGSVPISETEMEREEESFKFFLASFKTCNDQMNQIVKELWEEINNEG